MINIHFLRSPHIYKRTIVATGKHYIGKHNGNNDNFIKEWSSGAEAELFYSGRKINVNINSCCKNKQKTAFNYIWKYKI